MSTLTNFLRSKIFPQKYSFTAAVAAPLIQCQQIRNQWVDNRMKKDARKRATLKEMGPQKLRLRALYKNDVLPIELREIVKDEITNKIHRDSHVNRIVHRCQLTSKPRNVLVRWRLGRMMFRHLADGNRLSGVQRALW